jgi:hypothetical protein
MFSKNNIYYYLTCDSDITMIKETTTILAVVAIATAFGTAGLLTALSLSVPAHADPQTPHGTCTPTDKTGPGAQGCAGNFGGFIQTPNGRCHTTGGPFNKFSCP